MLTKKAKPHKRNANNELGDRVPNDVADKATNPPNRAEPSGLSRLTHSGLAGQVSRQEPLQLDRLSDQ